MSRIFLLFTFLLLVLCASQPMYAGAADTSCGIIWDEPIQLSDSNYNAYSPKVALSGDDTVHVTWWGGGTRLPYRRSTNAGHNFAPTRELLTDSVTFPFDANRPSIVAWHQNVYAFFQGGTLGIYSPIRMVKSTDSGSTWSYPSDISPDTSGPPPLTPTVLGDTIAMTYVRRGQVPHKILRSTDRGETWVAVDAGLPNSHSLSLGTSAALSPGVLHLVQLGSAGSGETEYRRSHDLGDSWVQTEVISTIDQHTSHDMTIAASDTLLIAAWRDPKYGCLGTLGCSIIGRVGMVGVDSTSWSNEQLLSDVPHGYRPAVAVSGGRFAAAWCVDQPTPPYAQVKTTQDAAWHLAFDPSAIPTQSVTDVAVALSSNALHVVWEANQAPSPGTFRIFYRRGLFKTVGVKYDPPSTPELVHLDQNHPNPFNPTTSIRYALEKRMFVTMKVYDMLGREIRTLISEQKEPGDYTVQWDAESIPTGVYFYRLFTEGEVLTRKAILIR